MTSAASTISQTNLKEPDQVDWDSAFKGTSYAPPPPALGPDNKPIKYTGTIVEVKQTEGFGLDKDFLNYQVEVRLTRSGAYDGQTVRTWASTRTFQKKTSEGTYENVKGNPNALAKLLKSAGLNVKPRTNAEYANAMKSIAGKQITFTIDWEARDRESGETVRGYQNFPVDPSTGVRKAILKAGDVLPDERIVSSSVLFANARIKYFEAPANAAGR